MSEGVVGCDQASNATSVHVRLWAVTGRQLFRGVVVSYLCPLSGEKQTLRLSISNVCL